MLFNKYFTELWHRAAQDNNLNLSKLMEKNPTAKLLDLGCDDGKLVKDRVSEFIGTGDIYGLDIDRKILTQAKKRGLKTYCLDINNHKLPFKNNFFDVVQANQVIEHLWDTDTVISEIFRVLKPGGYALIATENLSSWHNIFSLLLGYQAPSQDISSKFRVGNPFSLCHDRPRLWTAHQRIFTLRGLIQLLKKYNFKIEKTAVSGYYPLPSIIAEIMGKIDPYHAAFICIKAEKAAGSNKLPNH